MPLPYTVNYKIIKLVSGSVSAKNSISPHAHYYCNIDTQETHILTRIEITP